MRLINKIVLLIILFSLVIFKPDVMAKELKDGKKNTGLSKTTGLPATTWFTINNVNTILRNDGMSDLNGNDSGFEFPAGSNHSAFYESGFIYGGYYKGEWRVGGSAYDHSQLPGRILADGTAESGSLPYVRIYRVRRDYKSADADFSREMAKQGLTKAQVIDQYTKDWNEWPAQYGAPYEDVNGNNQYDPTVDIPGVPGADQTIWFVCNDLDPSPQTKFYGTLGLGMEMQATFWGYNTSGALGNAMFRKYQLINKGGQNIDSMFVCMWSDPDLGDAGDDYVGCDTTLSLGYCYNGKAVDATYGVNVPAVGFDFFQGPIIKGAANDQAVFKGKYKPGYKNLGMSSFFFFINSDAVYRDPTQGDKVGAQHWKNLFTGKISTTGVPFKDPTTGKNTKFTLAGDPVTGRGWIDGIIHRPGDRRLGMVAGPFTFAAKDTQEVVVGQFAAGATAGVDRLQAVGLLKFNDIELQNTYNVFFQVPPAVKAPQVTATALDQKVSLVWGDRPDIYNQTESYDKLGYKFQGYVVYQLPKMGSTIADGKEVATFDLVDLVGNIQSLVFDPVSGTSTTKFTKHGLNTGIERFITISKDLIRNAPIVNGTHYYYAVTAYAYNPDPNAVPNVLETPLTILDVVPQSTNPGTTFNGTSGQVINATNTAAVKSDGIVKAIVVDPSKTTGSSYSVTFKDDPANAGALLWTLKKGTAVLLDNQKNITGNGDYPVVDGLQVKVSGPAVTGLKSEADGGFAVAAGARRWTQLDGDGLAFEGWRGAVGWMSPANYFSSLPMLVTSGQVHHILFKGGKVKDNKSFAPVFDETDPNISYGYRYLRSASAPAGDPKFAPYILKPTSGSYGFQEYAKNVPFSVWNIDDPANPKRLAVGFLENNVKNGLVDGKYWPAVYSELEAIPTDNTASSGPREWLFIMDDPYTDATPDAKYTSTPLTSSTTARIMYWATWNRRDANAWTGADQWALYANKPLTKSDVFSFTAPSVTYSVDQAKTDVDQINAFPNPYYGANPRETDKYVRFITFSHLPKVATLRVFNLAGQLVNTIKKDDSSPYATWNLANDGGIPVASGLYIVHVEMPEIGSTKILKIAIIQEQQILDRF